MPNPFTNQTRSICLPTAAPACCSHTPSEPITCCDVGQADILGTNGFSVKVVSSSPTDLLLCPSGFITTSAIGFINSILDVLSDRTIKNTCDIQICSQGDRPRNVVFGSENSDYNGPEGQNMWLSFKVCTEQRVCVEFKYVDTVPKLNIVLPDLGTGPLPDACRYYVVELRDSCVPRVEGDAVLYELKFCCSSQSFCSVPFTAKLGMVYYIITPFKAFPDTLVAHWLPGYYLRVNPVN